MKSLVVVFFVLAAGCAGHQAGQAVPADPVMGAASEPFFDPEVIQELELEITPANKQAMLEALPELIYVPATFRWNDIELENVGVRFKGNSSSRVDAMHKRSYLVKFSEFVDKQRFLGLRRVALDNAVQFGSLFSERLLTDILRAENVPCSRANYARLTVNGAYEGLFVNVERIDKSFLERVYGSRDGVLYKVHEGGPGADLGVLSTAAAYGETFEAKTHKDDADFVYIREFALLLRDTSDDALEGRLEAAMELDEFLRLMAVMMLGGAFDQYTGWGPHNYYLYQDPTTERIRYIVWDLDVGFADDAFGRVPVIDGWNASYPLPVTPRPLLARILAHPDLRARYRAHAARILEEYFVPSELGAKLDTLLAQAEDSLADDPFPPGRITVPTDTSWDDVVDSQKAFMQRRYDTATAELAAPLNEPPAPVEPPDQQPMPGEAGSNDPTNLRVERIDASGVTVTWDDHASMKAAAILQRCEGAGCTDFANHVGVPGAEVSSITDPGATPGTTYLYRVYVMFGTPAGPRGSGTSNVIEATR